MPPIGPTNFAIMSKGFNKDIVSGVAIGAGAGFMDMIYILIAYGGLSLLKTIVPESFDIFVSDNEHYFKAILTFLGCIIVIFSGYKIMKTRIFNGGANDELIRAKIEKKLKEAGGKFEKREKELEKLLHTSALEKRQGVTGSFLTGVVYCMSSITLPASWFAIVSYMKSYGIIDSRFITGLALAVGVLVGTTLWFYTLCKLISKNSHRISHVALNRINTFVGIVLIGLGIFLFYKAFDFFYV